MAKDSETNDVSCEAYLSLISLHKTIKIDKTPSDISLADIHSAFIEENGDEWSW